jgi:hypothetical protein
MLARLGPVSAQNLVQTLPLRAGLLQMALNSLLSGMISKRGMDQKAGFLPEPTPITAEGGGQVEHLRDYGKRAELTVVFNGQKTADSVQDAKFANGPLAP